ncbi:MAG: hypothetical protein NW237_06585 [Cyanobacteriota bacterium]|nr:hypothetical protein [Cyanobacteriota bacterium]
MPKAGVEQAARSLISLGVSVSWLAEDNLSALIRLGSKGSIDRACIYQVELRFSPNPREQVQWLEMCWGLPTVAQR